MGQDDVEPHGRSAHFLRAPVGRFHDARSTARAHEKLFGDGPRIAVARHQAGKQARLVVEMCVTHMALRDDQGVLRRLDILCGMVSVGRCRDQLGEVGLGSIERSAGLFRGWKAGAPEHHHGAFDTLFVLPQIRFEHFQLEAYAAGFAPE